MTPADLAELLKTTAAAVLAEHGLDAAALPAIVTVERPRNPEHGDYATNLALQLAKKVGVNPRDLAEWLADGAGRGRRHRRGRRGRARLRQPAHRGLGPGRRRRQGPRRGCAPTATPPTLAGTEHQPGVRLREPDRADPHRRHALGRGRRRARPAAGHPGRRGGTRVLLQRPRRADRPVRPLAGRRGQGPARARGRLRGRLHRRHRRRRWSRRRPTR